MSRHRYVRNMDLDVEMEDAGEGGDGMTADERARLATSLPLARELLKDLKPPISDNAICDSLWHYWFDVEKAVTWLRKDWEKKGETIPLDLLPTPDEQRRRGSVKSPRLGPSNSSTASTPASALQQLAAARDSKRPGSSVSIPTNEPTVSALAVNTFPMATPTPSKPKSKLAMLAEKRKAAAGTSANSLSAPQTPSVVSRTPSPGNEEVHKKPLSKLAQKMAESRAAKAPTAENQIGDPTNFPLDSVHGKSDDFGMSSLQLQDEPSDLFPGSTAAETAIATPQASSFFGLITSASPKDEALYTQLDDVLSIHLPIVENQDALEYRVRTAFGSNIQSPDDIVLSARQGRAAARASGSTTPISKSQSVPGKPRDPVPSSLAVQTQPNTPKKIGNPSVTFGTNTPTSNAVAGPSGLQSDMEALHLNMQDDGASEGDLERFKEKPGLNMKQEELIEKVKQEEEASGRQGISLIVVGHVDAGKSTLMGRLLYDLGDVSEKEKTSNERNSKKAGKGSFAFAWGLDALGDERDRGVTIDIATTHFDTPHRNITLLDAPGHRDFIPAMISGAAQADVALLVVDGSPGEFEAGFERGGQTREHAWLVRSLGVKEIIVGVNKMDMVEWSQDRYDDIVDALKPFLVSAGFAAAKTTFLPLAAMEGVNILSNHQPLLEEWYSGPTLIDTLDKVEVPSRPYALPVRLPLSNVFKGQTAVASGIAVSGRLCSGVIQVGDRLRAVPGDEVASLRTIELDDESVPYAVAGQNVTLYLSGIDAIHLAIGSVLCPVNDPVSLATTFEAQILVFDVQTPIIVGTAIELFHHSMNVPATISKLLSISEKGVTVKRNPRVLQKGVTALVEITLRVQTSAGRSSGIPLETAAANKEMGRVLIRRQGESIAAGVVQTILS